MNLRDLEDDFNKLANQKSAEPLTESQLEVMAHLLELKLESEPSNWFTKQVQEMVEHDSAAYGQFAVAMYRHGRTKQSSGKFDKFDDEDKKLKCLDDIAGLFQTMWEPKSFRSQQRRFEACEASPTPFELITMQDDNFINWINQQRRFEACEASPTPFELITIQAHNLIDWIKIAKHFYNRLTQ